MSDTRGRTGGDARKPMIGIYDFSYGPYALGDALTWTMNLNIGAAEAMRMEHSRLASGSAAQTGANSGGPKFTRSSSRHPPRGCDR